MLTVENLLQAAHEHLSRLEGKSEEEKKIEIRNMQTQMLVSVVDGNRKAVETDPNNSVALSELAKSLFELSMLQDRDEGAAVLAYSHSNTDRPVSYTHLRAHETSLHLVCRLLLEKKNRQACGRQR